MAHGVSSTVIMAALLLLIAAATPALAQPPSVSINWVTFGGTGCSWSNSNYVYSSDSKTITFIFGGMVATTDGVLADKRKACQISMSVNYPDGWSYTLGQVTGRGFADVAAGSKGVYETQFYFSGQTGTPSVSRTLTGKYVDSFEFTDYFTTSVWSQCNNTPNLNIKSVVRVEGSKAVMALDSSDTKFQLVYYFNWKQC
ncbi:hypothetical protein CBR_g68775 [Chara braunii]|uniref:DUF4360 domain-containing protein n=1 Tax=Chara braunii TaxID=69332 RepID=A0A388K9T4_CHABU|nr:hypothetical protein CBR_g68773 [Chara braunii]GBG66789.1 hypothetical protein CBR_g68775 [Chara braunii]|eukprot:GBG66787.1 hypothetical protein CBR_g68773 [Chara braunii]